ncbi:glycosyltransferase [Pontibacter sp. Tf4]|uniref:glycosyltransferase n=1 Tax=Pontibacter sp. Tf4 TaxID=2761620 RepID=UPI0016239070|nr:glycosyltransferase [Pontibacter sp. Tf4]MBB6612716.1 glycosyltransferase [Pontibacter sp. Tf4]
MKKIAFFVTSLNAGGIENYLLRFLKYSEGEILPIVVCKSNQYGDLLGDYQQIKNIKLLKVGGGFFNIKQFINIYQLLSSDKIHAICDFTGNFAGIPLFIAKLVGVKKRIAFYRGATNRFKEDKIRLYYNSMVKKLVMDNADYILSNSKSALNFFFHDRSVDDKRYQVISNGIDSAKFCEGTGNLRNELSIPDESFVIGHVGRFDNAKNHQTIIQVIKRLSTYDSNIYFVLCGKGVDENLGEIIKESKFGNQVKLLGYRSDVNKVLKTLNAFYFPSLTEGQPNALIEAMVIGLPFVASNINPILETVPYSLHKQLVAPKDVDGAVSKLLDIYQSDNRSRYTCADWAKEKYSAHNCFSLFMEKLK